MFRFLVRKGDDTRSRISIISGVGGGGSPAKPRSITCGGGYGVVVGTAVMVVRGEEISRCAAMLYPFYSRECSEIIGGRVTLRGRATYRPRSRGAASGHFARLLRKTRGEGFDFIGPQSARRGWKVTMRCGLYSCLLPPSPTPPRTYAQGKKNMYYLVFFRTRVSQVCSITFVCHRLGPARNGVQGVRSCTGA